MKNNSTLSGLIWSFAERFGAQLISLIVSLVLARILMPSDYGIVVTVSIFINVANAFVTGGFGNSLIQKKDADELDFSTIFWFNIVFSFFVYAVVFLSSPFAEQFYEQEGLALVMQILGIRLLFTGVNSVQRAYVARRMEFKKFFFATLAGTVISAVIGIWMAVKGFGVWALVAQYLINTTVDTIVLFAVNRWRPKFIFSFQRLKQLLSYGWKLLISSVLSAIYVELNEFVIGKVYSTDDLAFYNKGKQIPSLISTNVISAIETVLFPSMSMIQDEKVRLKEKTRKSIQFSTFFIFPMLFGLAAIANTFILVVLTDKWASAVPFMMLACISFMLNPIGMANLQAYKAMGKSGLYLGLDISKKIIGIAALIVCLRHGVLAIAIGVVVGNFIGFFLNIIPNRKYLNYGLFEQIKDILPTFLIALVMFFIVYAENYIPINGILLLLTQIITGASVYCLLAFLTRNKTLFEVKTLIRGLKKRNEQI